MVGDHSRQMKLKFIPKGTSASVGDGFSSLLIPFIKAKVLKWGIEGPW